MAEHVLKTAPPYFEAVLTGDKTFEVRRDDRGFQRGDTLRLREYDRRAAEAERLSSRDGRVAPRDRTFGFTGREVRKRITYVLTGGQLGIEPGYVVMGLGEVAA